MNPDKEPSRRDKNDLNTELFECVYLDKMDGDSDGRSSSYERSNESEPEREVTAELMMKCEVVFEDEPIRNSRTRKRNRVVPVARKPAGLRRGKNLGRSLSLKETPSNSQVQQPELPPATQKEAAAPLREPAEEPHSPNLNSSIEDEELHACLDSGSESDEGEEWPRRVTAKFRFGINNSEFCDDWHLNALDGWEDLDPEWAGEDQPTRPDNQDQPTKPEDQNQPTRPEPDLSSSVSSNTFTWSEDFNTFSGEQEVYLNTPGSQVAEGNPLDIFRIVWDSDIIAQIVNETNNYARDTITKLFKTNRVPTSLKNWADTTVEEIYRLLALLNYMSIDFRSRVDDYWTMGVLGMPHFREIMSRQRFCLLMRFLHFVHNDTIHTRGNERKISKVRPLLNHCNLKFSRMYTPQQPLSLNSSLLLLKRRTNAPPSRIEAFELCESASGYMLRCLLSADRKPSNRGDNGIESPTAKVVLKLLDGFLDVGHMLVMDSPYNQLPLVRYLKHRHTDVIGTVKRRRAGVPPEIKNADELVMNRGDQISVHCGDITMTAWKDLELVTAMSTFHNNEQIGRTVYPFRKPVLIDCYNRHMGGVSLKDQKLSMFILERSSNKFYINVFRRLLNTSLLNTHIIYSKHAGAHPLGHRDFRYKVADSLLYAYRPGKVPRPRIVPGSDPSKDLVPIRLIYDNEHDHFPVSTELQPENSARHKRRRCVCCTRKGKRVTTTTMCRTCAVPLCIQCWEEYHTVEDL